MSNKKGKNNKKKRINIFQRMTLWVVFAFLVAGGGALFAWFQLEEYESGVAEIYAVQQDSLVQLVLDQINLNRGQKDESVITDIIGTLDSSNNKYWTLSDEAAMVFVKDVTETNRYKGFTAETYFGSDSARRFLDGLSMNRVTHSMIVLGGRDYIASGVRFSYQDREYEICLLTNPDAVLDHNAYLGARINLSVMIGVVLCVFLITVVALAGCYVKKLRQLEEEKQNTEVLSRMVEKLNNELSMDSLFDARLAVFRLDQAKVLFAKLEERERLPVTLMQLEYDSEAAAALFLEDAYLQLDRRIFRFRDRKKKRLVLVGVGCDDREAVKAVEWLLCRKLRLTAVECIDSRDAISLEEALEKLCGKETEAALTD